MEVIKKSKKVFAKLLLNTASKNYFGLDCKKIINTFIKFIVCLQDLAQSKRLELFLKQHSTEILKML